MSSSLPARHIGLDHIRALAALMVFSWHFTHYATGYPVPFEGAPSIFFLSVFDEGHTGVALFMTLSGYLFAKILAGQQINYGAFLLRRFLRLMPLLLVMLLLVGVQQYLAGNSVMDYGRSLPIGLITPTLPNGGWSLTVEFHFYLILPLLLLLCRKSPFLLLAVLLAAVVFRVYLYGRNGTIFWPAYWTIVGRIDQFLLGILAYHYRKKFIGRHVLAGAAIAGFCLFYWYFDRIGGFYRIDGYPSPTPLWIIIPTIEGAFFGLLIAYYDYSFDHSAGLFSRFIARIGEYSYSMYLLHFFVVFAMADYVHRHIMDISYFYTGQVWAVICFLLLVPFTYLSYVWFERPFMRIRVPYTRARATAREEYQIAPCGAGEPALESPGLRQ
ncbi:acyltransferase family protein [Phyllobacterium lublinensis]|uniref:acyltransferase family protein n=1 Tax=Phyllobacterium lublinensis TaxID=2875708 RepID=UPI001CC96460|nr:acyltransferase [Phyllobacterium sp. 2063]MBZ9656071.1 acyltransferase [Phyllobacterium sp. 2063]